MKKNDETKKDKRDMKKICPFMSQINRLDSGDGEEVNACLEGGCALWIADNIYTASSLHGCAFVVNATNRPNYNVPNYEIRNYTIRRHSNDDHDG